MTSSAAVKADVAATATANMMSIPLTVLRIQGARNVDFYICQEGDEEPTLYCSADVELTNADLDRLGERGHKFLYVTRKAYADVNDQLNAALKDILADDSIGAENRLGVLQTALALEVDAAFQTINADKFVTLSQQMASQINELLCDREVVPRKLFEILRHDFYTFTHVTNVASFATLLAEELGYSDPAERERITVGALLHDIGKKFVPNTLLCKKRRAMRPRRPRSRAAAHGVLASRTHRRQGVSSRPRRRGDSRLGQVAGHCRRLRSADGIPTLSFTDEMQRGARIAGAQRWNTI
jgi:hypothetical protein